jgi:hypothetical protein
MKQQVHPAVVVAVLVVVVLGAVFAIYKGGNGINSGNGKLQSDLKLDEAAKKAQSDPEAFKKEIQDSMKKNNVKMGSEN